jgi:hypothetical protein
MFVKACDEFLYLPTSRPAPKSSRPATASRHAVDRNKREREVPAIAREVVSNLLSRATGPLNPSFIKETLVRKEPDFDEREHGFSTFSRMLEAMEKEGLLKRMQQGRQWYVVGVDGAPASGGPSRDEDDSEEEEVIPDPED